MSTSRTQGKQKSPELGIMDRCSPIKFGLIPATNTKKKVDAFKLFRPKSGEVLDYNISETLLKMEHKGVQINYKETKSEFVPAPEEYMKKHQLRKRIIHSHGGPPQWKFINEIWLEKQEEFQKVNKKEFHKFISNRRKRDANSHLTKHNLMQSLVGPEWYQELSLRQIEIIDGLRDCIKKDLKTNSSCFTKEAIANLGLVLRPHHKKIELALKYCCNSPVEFLFILYQLLDPNRKNYSINDRLLLSSVVHLTMTETLRELHVRIPSPVKNLNSPTVPNRLSHTKKNYNSPYLVPYTFKPEPQKFKGIYRKKHIQYPESCYFSYIKDLDIERKLIEDYGLIDLKYLDETGIELVKETIEAQKLYNQIQNTKDVKLLKPKVLKTCKDYEEYVATRQDRNEIKLPPLHKYEQTPNECKCSPKIKRDTAKLTGKCNTEQKRSNTPTVSSFCDTCAWRRENININRIVMGTAIIECSEIIQIHGGIYFDASCSCREKLHDEFELLETKNKIEKLTQKFINNGVVTTPFGKVYFLSSAIWSNRLKNLLKCPTKTNENAFQLEELATPAKEPITEENCPCNNHPKLELSARSSSLVATTTGVCQCENALNVYLKNQCTCENCNVERRRKEATYLLSGLIDCGNEPPVNILSGVQCQQCNCLQYYLDKMKRLEEYRKRCQTAFNLKRKGVKYALGGVTVTEEGPVYQITGMRAPIQCICAETLKNIKQTQEESRRQPKIPPTGRIKYGIGGIKQTSNENVFIISQALDCEECDCEKLYKEFMAEHSNCWEAYQFFLKNMETETVEYYKEYGIEINQTQNHDKNNTVEDDIETKDSVLKSCKIDLGKQDNCEYPNKIPPKSEDYGNKENMYISNENCSYKNHDHELEKKNQEETLESSNKNLSDEHLEHNKECSCECAKSDSLIFDSNYAIKSSLVNTETIGEVVDTKSMISESSEGNKIVVKRFAILKELPRDSQSQRLILKEILVGMATDGFALAKLPDCYKLPHFKLWMELRCGRKWTQENRKYYNNFSIFAWGHTDYCYQILQVPQLKLDQASLRKITWNSAEWYRRLINNKKNKFHRDIKQQLINKTREFFPTVVAYEFPTREFRNCYFAYLPNKEEDAVFGS